MTRSLAIAFAVAGCAGPAALSAPPAEAPAPARLGAYQALRPVRIDNRHEAKGGDVLVTLGDGRRVDDPSALSDVVLPDSTTARAIARYQDAHAHARTVLEREGLILGGTLIAGTAELALIHDGGHRTEAVGATIVVAGVLAILVPILSDAPSVEQAERAAYDSYDADLRARLRICADGLRVSACP